MKVSVYVRHQDDARGLFLGHADHTELDSVIEMFNKDSVDSRTVDLHDGVWWPLYLQSMDPDGYGLIGVQFAADGQQKNLIFEIIVGQPHE